MGSKGNIPKIDDIPDVNFEEDGSVVFVYRKHVEGEPRNQRPIPAELLFLMACLGADSGGCNGSH